VLDGTLRSFLALIGKVLGLVAHKCMCNHIHNFQGSWGKEQGDEEEAKTSHHVLVPIFAWVDGIPYKMHSHPYIACVNHSNNLMGNIMQFRCDKSTLESRVECSMNKVQCNMDQCNKVGLKNIVMC
jgi:hypothetical protein